jgi:hypothetical protein
MVTVHVPVPTHAPAVAGCPWSATFQPTNV